MELLVRLLVRVLALADGPVLDAQYVCLFCFELEEIERMLFSGLYSCVCKWSYMFKSWSLYLCFGMVGYKMYNT